jgi:RND superfamily putative drug exporter
MNRLVRRIGDLSARRPWTTIGAWAVLAALVAVLSGAVGGAFTDEFSASGSESRKAKTLLEERFPSVAGGTGLAVFAAGDGRKLSESKPAIAAALAQVAALPHVATVSDPFTTNRISSDGRVGYAEITLDVSSFDFGRPAAAKLVEALEPARASGLSAEFGGEASFSNKKKESGKEAIGILAALVILVVAFGTVVAALVPIALALVGVAAGIFGVTVLAGFLDVSTAAPIFGVMVGLGVGIDYSLFIVSRYRDNRAEGQGNAESLSSAMGSSGTAVFFAGMTVVIAMAALVLTGIGVLASIGLSVSIIVLFAVATALTLLPAILTLLGDRIDAGRLVGRSRTPKPPEATAWWRLAHRISARPWPYLIAATVVLLTLAAPALSLKPGFPDAGDDPTSTSVRKAYDVLADGFGPGFNGPLLIVADLKNTGLDRQGVAALTERIAADPGIAEVGTPRLSPSGDTLVVQTVPTTEPADPATKQTIKRIRALTPAGVFVTGPTALTLDLDKQLSDTLPLFIGAILVASFLLLMLVFRSVVVPLKAAVMNLLSIGGAYGVVVAVFQWGWLASLFGLEGTFRIVSLFPTLFFAVLFGLSMDYEVFLVSRIREAFNATGDHAESVARGLATTGRVITSGALIMMVVFLSFVTDPDPFVKMIGLGLAAAIFIDATLVRLILVPATMALMGRANWWLPGWLDRVLPHLSLEGPSAQPPAAPVIVLPAQGGQPSPTPAAEDTPVPTGSG